MRPLAVPSFLHPRRHPSAYLLAAQLLSLVLYARLGGAESESERLLFSAGALVVVPLAVWVVRRSPSANSVAWALAIPAILLSGAAILFDMPTLAMWSSVLEAVLYFYAAISLIGYMLHDHEVTADELFASGATFTLLAWAFAYTYLVCQAIEPRSFIGAVEPARPRLWLELLFLSVSTLSGVGNGDVMPISPPARVLVMFEQMAGIGYVTIVVSRLIGLSIVKARA
ncbi:two pore domain potassium channel family protein [Lysobacter sp. TY2-98]|uniref:ion channel n=1 Tax=Lysobacter sp. TY2-98 TaxID=2290922 RepID=UPI000E2052F8|nr:potassium channel family protein [Lysobacter sp. TY2-98]AXK72907.1 two pore domain potassium channel family protein [Lysobacter sp. TY2-98]